MQLCERAQAGDRVAASELIDLFYERVFCYLRRLCGNEEEAEDLAQKTFLKVWAALSSFQGRSSFSTWIHGVAHHAYVDSCRRKNPADPMTDAWWDTCVAEGPSPFENVAERDLAHQLYAQVDQLDPSSRELIHLHYYQGLSIQETSEVLGVATSTVKYRLRDALDVLRARTADPKIGTR